MIGITYGTFDLLHIGHINLIRRIKENCDYLIVGVSTDSFNEKKGKKSVYNFNDRAEIIKSLRYVDLVIPENNWEQKKIDIQNHKVDVFYMGDDWLGKFDFLNKFCAVKYLSRTENISTTEIKNIVKNKF